MTAKQFRNYFFFDGVIAIIESKYLEKEIKANNNAYLEGARDYCESSDGIETFIRKYQEK